jgi:hypothetical protein
MSMRRSKSASLMCNGLSRSSNAACTKTRLFIHSFIRSFVRSFVRYLVIPRASPRVLLYCTLWAELSRPVTLSHHTSKSERARAREHHEATTRSNIRCSCRKFPISLKVNRCSSSHLTLFVVPSLSLPTQPPPSLPLQLHRHRRCRRCLITSIICSTFGIVLVYDHG